MLKLLSPATQATSDKAGVCAMWDEARQIEAANNADIGPITFFGVSFMVPGRQAVRLSGDMTYREMWARVLTEIGEAMWQYGLTKTTVMEPGSPIKFAVARQMPAGNLVFDGNWPTEMDRLAASYSVHALVNRPGAPCDATDVCDLELL